MGSDANERKAFYAMGWRTVCEQAPRLGDKT